MNAKEFKSYIETKQNKLAVPSSISSDAIKIEYLKNNSIAPYEAMKVINSMTNEGKCTAIFDNDIKENINLGEYNIYTIIASMDEDSIEELLKSKSKLEELFGQLSQYYVAEIVSNFKDEDKRFEIAHEYNFDARGIAQITQQCSDKKKTEILASKKYKFSKYDILGILAKFDIPNFLQLLRENNEVIQENEIKLYEIVKLFSADQQLEIFSNFAEMENPLIEKLKATAILEPKVKEQIDRTSLNRKYIEALDMNVVSSNNLLEGNSSYIDIDLEGDLTSYEGYDELITIRPQCVPLDKHDKLIELAQICPELKVRDELKLRDSTAHEFLRGEEWIRDVIEHIQDNWTDIQKVAYIDYRIGQKISYSPDFNTEVEDVYSARALWKIIDSGYGVCNGIAQIEQYILQHAGIEAEMVNSENHSFLKLKKIEIPRADGTSVKGATILDPTWNLTAHRFGAYPNTFARSYSEIRKLDIDKNGNDRKAHQNDEKLSDATIEVEEQALRQIYQSIGLAKADGKFPFSDVIKISDEIARKDITLEQKIEEQLNLLRDVQPDFYKCQNSTISILSGNILNHEEMDFRKLVVSRVYEREDEEKRPVMYVYCNLDGKNEIFFAVDSASKSFIKFDKEKFTERFECYERDMQKENGLRPWEKGAKQPEEELTRSSGKVISKENKEGEQR